MQKGLLLSISESYTINQPHFSFRI